MFQNVEYHKSNKKNKSKRIIEDYEKPKLKGKNVETLPNVMHNRNEADDIRQVRNMSSSWDPVSFAFNDVKVNLHNAVI